MKAEEKRGLRRAEAEKGSCIDTQLIKKNAPNLPFALSLNKTNMIRFLSFFLSWEKRLTADIQHVYRKLLYACF